MQPIINPWIFYLIDVLRGLNLAAIIVGIAGASLIVFGIYEFYEGCSEVIEYNTAKMIDGKESSQ